MIPFKLSKDVFPINSYQDLFDNRFGRTYTEKCDICSNVQCVGHSGVIQLDYYIPHPLWYPMVPNILDSRCGVCKLVFMPLSTLTTFKEYTNAIMNKNVRCKCPKPTFIKHKYAWQRNDKGELECTTGGNDIYITTLGKNAKITNMTSVKRLLSEYTNDEKTVMRLQHNFSLEDLIINYVIVMSPLLRPLNIGSTFRLDEASQIYTSILRHKSSPIQVFKYYLSLIGSTNNNVRLFREFISGKTGLIRMNMIGTRNNRIGRTVITTNSRIPVSHIGVPSSFKKSLTVMETIQSWNLQYIEQLFKDGKIVVDNGVKPKELYNHIGDTIERELDNGDWVFANRQPTLSHTSFLAFKALLVPTKTLVLNLAVTKAFNADFDGDEMTIYAASDVASRLECEQIMSVEHHIVQGSNVLIRPIQDTISAVYTMTKWSRTIDIGLLTETADIITEYGQLCRLREFFSYVKDPFNSRHILSLTLPRKLNIESLQIEQGIIPKDLVIGEKQMLSIILSIHETFGSNEAMSFISVIQVVADVWHKIYPLSIAYSDTELFNEDQVIQLRQKYVSIQDEVTLLEETKKSYTDLSDICESQIVELLLDQVTSSLLSEAKLILSTSNNPFVIMVDSGARGTYMALTNIGAYLGQQSVNGRQPSLVGDSNNIEDRGFVTTSYRKGLDFKGTYYQAASGRQGIVNTGVGVTSPGVTYRLLWSFLADVRIQYGNQITNYEGLSLNTI